MLRNILLHIMLLDICVLNEVLSLNAQEWLRVVGVVFWMIVLNEVLSLNAQE